MTTAKLVTAITVALCAVSWISFAEHPTARNLRSAIVNTLPFP